MLIQTWWARCLVVAALLALGAPAARAQINTEKMRAKKKKKGLHGYVDGTVLWQTGSTNVLQAGVGARIAYFTGVHRPFLQGEYVLGAKDGDRYVHYGFLHARWPAMWHPRVGTEVFAQLEFNEFKLMQLRTLGGVGVRVAAVLSKHFELYVGSGYMFEYEDLKLEDLDLPPTAALAHPRHPEKTYNHRWTSYVSLRVDVTKWVMATNVVYAQPRFDDFKDVRVLEDFALSFTVYKSLKVVLAFVLDWDSEPPIEIPPLDTKLFVKVRWTY